MINTKQMQSGRSMIEMLGVLAIIGVLSVGGIAGYSKAMMKFKVNKTVDEVTQIATNIRTLFGGQRSYEALTNDVINKGHLIPDEMEVRSGTGENVTITYENAWAEAVKIAPANKVKDGDKKGFIVSFAGIPTEACLELAVMDWGSSSGSGLVAFGVGDDITDIGDAEAPAGTTATAVKNVITSDCATHTGTATTVSDNFVCANAADKNARVPMNPAQAAELCSANTDTGTVNMHWKFY